jgi:hypothetical protein
MFYDIDKFVNTNKANIYTSFDCDEDEVQCATEFEKLVKFDEIDSTAYPVLIYKMNTKAVAWYDLEMYMGFVPQ